MSLLDRITQGDWIAEPTGPGVASVYAITGSGARMLVADSIDPDDARAIAACPQVIRQMVRLYRSHPHNGEPGSELRRECESTRRLIDQLERTA